jgi:hypothetical protein
MARKKKSQAPSPISAYLAVIGKKGGKAGTGKAKARSSEQARKAVMKRWGKRRTPNAQRPTPK